MQRIFAMPETPKRATAPDWVPPRAPSVPALHTWHSQRLAPARLRLASPLTALRPLRRRSFDLAQSDASGLLPCPVTRRPLAGRLSAQ